ncbi:MAG: DUF3458 domain-containing protein, partial [Bdellovibrionaceae bacterium]|nr:DUF3458 domain-containing protein [Pseudobdellovibrionaceae bacterium]
MQQTLVGRKGFRKGMDLYFERHDGQAVIIEDFVAAIADANRIDLSQFMRWYTQAGTPVIKASEVYDPAKREYRLTLSQRCPPTPGQSQKHPLHIPVRIGLIDDLGREVQLNCDGLTVNSDGEPLLELKEAEQSWVFRGLDKKPHLSLLREFSAPVIVERDVPEEEYYFLMAHDTDGFNRREAGQRAAMLELRRLVAAIRDGAPVSVSGGYLEALKMILKEDSLHPFMKAAMLELPGLDLLAQQEAVLLPEVFRRAEETLQAEIGRYCAEELLRIYRRYHGVDPHKVDTHTIGHRRLKNFAMFSLAATGSPEAVQLVRAQFNT